MVQAGVHAIAEWACEPRPEPDGRSRQVGNAGSLPISRRSIGQRHLTAAPVLANEELYVPLARDVGSNRGGTTKVSDLSSQADERFFVAFRRGGTP